MPRLLNAHAIPTECFRVTPCKSASLQRSPRGQQTRCAARRARTTDSHASGCLYSHCEKVVRQRVAERLPPRADASLLIDVADVTLDGPHAEYQLVGDFAIAEAL